MEQRQDDLLLAQHEANRTNARLNFKKFYWQSNNTQEYEATMSAWETASRELRQERARRGLGEE